MMPYMIEHGIPIIRVTKMYKGEEDTVLKAIYRENRTIPIPVRMKNGAPGNRTCTFDYKINVVDKWCIKQGFSHVTVGLGFSVDEIRRTQNKNVIFQPHNSRRVNKTMFKRFDFPLVDLGFTRLQSINLVERAGLPTPPRSSCWFCPFKSRGEWIEDKKNRPHIVADAIKVEEQLNLKRGYIGKDRVYLHPATGGRMHPLEDAIGDQLSLFEEACDSGYCGL